MLLLLDWRAFSGVPVQTYLLWALLAASVFTLDLMPFRFTTQPIETTIADLPAIASSILFTPPLAALPVFLAKLASEAYFRVRPLIALFNASAYAIATYLCSFLIHRLYAPGYPRTLGHAFAIFVFGYCFLMVHDGLVSIAVAIEKRHRVLDLLGNSTLFARNLLFSTLPVVTGAIVLAYSLETRNIFAGGSLAAVLVLLYASLRREEKVRQAIKAAVTSLNETIGARDEYTKNHCLRVAELARLTAHELDLGIVDIELVEHAAMLHDLGKINFSDSLFTKKKLGDDDWHQIRSHPEVGRQILESMEEFVKLQAVIELHHERCDGTGYPHGLKRHQIPLAARILALADSFDAMTSQRAYRKGFSPEFAVREILSFRGTAFDPRITDAFLKVVCEKYGVTLPPVDRRVRKTA